ncbi:hypothetical protein [Mangrovimonas sp. DI 80]|uniref:hypothetical protein n=1 Tax=Mangrovimonas sp. DI 80 TaxID=1779330 RepID=UPI000975EA35|nr:hypothetical protein [Mangrovimonas sp. DI 80]OMP30001.1 hypothetical protein BKM32_15495 [Mangrovimonas sp. DI 80]
MKQVYTYYVQLAILIFVNFSYAKTNQLDQYISLNTVSIVMDTEVIVQTDQTLTSYTADCIDDSIPPTAVTQDITVYLDASGNASIAPEDKYW